MNKRPIILPLLALVLAMAASAFTTRDAQLSAVNGDPLWHFTGTTTAQQSDPSLYELVEGNNPTCEGQNLYCIIQAPADAMDPSQPDLSGFDEATDVVSRKP